MHKKFLGSLFTFLISSFIFAQETEIKSNFQFPAIYLNSELSVKKYHAESKVNILGNLGVSFDFNQLEVSTLILGEKNIYDTNTSIIYTPLSKDKFDVGLHTIFHTETELKTYLDLDFLLGGFFSIHGAEHFIFEFSSFYMLKTTQVFYIKENCPWFITNSMAASLNFICPINDLWTVGFEFSSYNKTKFNLFITPFFTLYGSYNISENLKLHCDFQVNYIDMFTLSANINNIVFSAGADWRLR